MGRGCRELFLRRLVWSFLAAVILVYDNRNSEISEKNKGPEKFTLCQSCGKLSRSSFMRNTAHYGQENSILSHDLPPLYNNFFLFALPPNQFHIHSSPITRL